jgi:hypothetical protein
MEQAAGTELCVAPHFQQVRQGVVHVAMADGTELDIGPGELAVLPRGHDAWVVGDEPAVAGRATGAAGKPEAWPQGPCGLIETASIAR